MAAERIIEAGDDEIRVLFTNAALAAAEQRLGRSVLAIMRNLVDGTAGVEETAQLLRAGMEAANRGRDRVSMRDVYGIMDQVGFTTVLGVVLEAATEVLIYKGPASKNP